jgi:His-Xaa-Ser system protein HxsD
LRTKERDVDSIANANRHQSNDCVRIPVDTDLYSLEALFRACYKFTDRCYLFLERSTDHTVVVEIRSRHDGVDLGEVTGAFGNELIDQRLRADLTRSTHEMRDLIVRQAFVEADLEG